MTQTDVSKQTTAALQSLIKDGRLKGNLATVARQCLRRLDAPLQIGIVGTDAALATGVLNLLSGRKLADPAIGHLSLQVEYGKKASAVARYADKTEVTFGEKALDEAFKNNPTRVKLQMDLAPLSKASFYRITRDDPSNLTGILAKLADQMDVVLWCGQSFGRDDKNALESLEQRTRDHSHMLTSESCFSSVVDSIAEEEFVSIIPIDPYAAMAALNAEGGVDKAAFKAAGGTELIKAVKKEIEMTLQAAIDTAEVIVTRELGEQPAPVAPKAKAPAAKAKPKKAEKPKKPRSKPAPKAAPKASEAPKAKTPAPKATETKPVKAKRFTKPAQTPAAKPAQAPAPKPAPPGPGSDHFANAIAKAKAAAAKRERAKISSKPTTKPLAQPEAPTAGTQPDEVKAKDQKSGTPWALGVKGDGLTELDQVVDFSSGKLAIRETSFEDKPVDYK